MIAPLLFSFILLFSPLIGVNFVLFTQPKTGTQLLIPILETLTGKKAYWPDELMNQRKFKSFMNPLDFEDPNSFIFSLWRSPWDECTIERVWKTTVKQGKFLQVHAPYSQTMENYLAKKKCISFFVRRDPRDQIVSLLNHHKFFYMENKALKNISSDNERLLLMIQTQLREEIIHFRKWQESSLCCVLDFHKLMGSHGGSATDQDALEELRKITKALSINVSDTYLLRIYKAHFGKSWNFFRGKVGSWKDYLNEEHKSAIKKEIGDLLIEEGYENDDQW